MGIGRLKKERQEAGGVQAAVQPHEEKCQGEVGPSVSHMALEEGECRVSPTRACSSSSRACQGQMEEEKRFEIDQNCHGNPEVWNVMELLHRGRPSAGSSSHDRVYCLS